MTKYAYQNIRHNLGLDWRSGPKPGNKFSASSNVVAWWSLVDDISEATDAATKPNTNFIESTGKNMILSFANTAARSKVSTDVPSKKISENAPKFGNNNKATISHNDLNFTTGQKDKPFSVSFWAKADGSNDGEKYVIHKGTTADNYEYKIGFNSKAPLISLRDGSGNVITTAFPAASATLSESNWMHYVFTYDANSDASRNGIVLYVNGSRIVDNSVGDAEITETNNGSYTARPYRLSALTVGDAVGNFNGFLSSLSFFDKVIDDESIKSLYTAKLGTYIQSRNYDKKGSSTLIESGGSIDPFREGVSITSEQHIGTSTRAQIFVGSPQHGSFVYSQGPNKKPGRNSVAELKCFDALDPEIQIKIESTDGTSITYIGVTEGHGSIATGDLIEVGDNPGGGVASTGDPRVGMVAFHVGSDGPDASNMIRDAINSVNGHNQGIINKKISVESNAGVLKLKQVQPGSSGNTAIIITGGLGATVNDKSLVVSKLYQIKTVGNTYWEPLGAKPGNVGVGHRFIAIRGPQSTSYTGDAYEVRIGIKSEGIRYEGKGFYKGTDAIRSNSYPSFDATGAPTSIITSAASTTITISPNAPLDNNIVIKLKATDGKTASFKGVSDIGDKPNGHFDNGFFFFRANVKPIAKQLKEAIEASSLDIKVSRNENVLRLVQGRPGHLGNTPVNITGDTSNRVTVENNKFTTGRGSFSADIIGSYYHGVLDSTYASKGMKRKIIDHSIVQNDFGVFEGGYHGRHQDGSPFSETSFVQCTEILNPHDYRRSTPLIQPVQVEAGKRYTVIKLSNVTDLNEIFPEPDGSPNSNVTLAELGVASANEAVGITFIAAANGPNSYHANDNNTLLQEVPSNYDRHLKPMIHSTPDILYNASEVYNLSGRVDVFDKTIELKNTILDLRDLEKDFTKRPKRLIKSGSVARPIKNRGITAESNCIQCTDVRYHDIREAVSPYFELNLDGDLSVAGKITSEFPDDDNKPVIIDAGVSLRHETAGKLEKIMSQSSGPRSTSQSLYKRSITLNHVVSGSWYRIVQTGNGSDPFWVPEDIGSSANTVGTIFQANMTPPLSEYRVIPLDGPGTNPSTPNYLDTYGTYMESTVDTFYGTPEAHSKPPGQSFGVRYKVSSADRPYHDRAKQDLIGKVINRVNIDYENISAKETIVLEYPAKITDYSVFDVRKPMGHDIDSTYKDQDNLYAFYKLESDDPGDLKILDLSGNQRSLREQVEEGGEPSDVPAHSGLNPGWGIKGSKTFAAPGQLLTTAVNRPADFRFTTADGSGNPQSDLPFTVMAWVRPVVVNTTAYIIAKGDFHDLINDGSHDLEWALFRENQKFVFELYGYQGGTIKIHSGNVASANEWYQVIVTYSGNSANTGLNIYVNGQKIGSPTRSGSYTGVQAHRHSNVRISLGNAIDTQNSSTGEAGGTTNGAGSRFWNGQIAAVAVWDKELSESSAKGLYQYLIEGDFQISLPGFHETKPLKKTYTLVDCRREILGAVSSIDQMGQIIKPGHIIGGETISRFDDRVGNIAVMIESQDDVANSKKIITKLEEAINSRSGHNKDNPNSAFPISYGGETASTEIKITVNYAGSGNDIAALLNAKITIVSAEGLSVTYIGVRYGYHGMRSGDLLAVGHNPDGLGEVEEGDPRIGMTCFEVYYSGPYAINHLATAISSENGHGSNLSVTKISFNGTGPGVSEDPKVGHIKLTQTKPGAIGNTSVTVVGDGSNLVTAPAFTGGSDLFILGRSGIIPEFVHPVTSSIQTIKITETYDSNTDLLTATRMLYKTGSSVHASSMTGYNHAQGGFFTDPHGPRRDSIAYLGLKRG